MGQAVVCSHAKFDLTRKALEIEYARRMPVPPPKGTDDFAFLSFLRGFLITFMYCLKKEVF
jgi:hypothetical protein